MSSELRAVPRHKGPIVETGLLAMLAHQAKSLARGVPFSALSVDDGADMAVGGQDVGGREVAVRQSG